MRFLHAVPLGAALMLCATWLHAAAPEVSLPLAPAALREAVRAVWQASPELAAAQAERAAAHARSRASARPLYNPELVLEAEDADVNRRVAGLGLTLDISGKRRARAAQGEASAQAGEAAYVLRRRELAARWLKAWSARELAVRQRALGRQRLALMHRFDALSGERLRVGDVSSPERDLAALALGEAQLQQATLEAQASAAQAALVAMTGAPIALPALPDALPPDAAGAVATGALPELRQARFEAQAAEAGVRVARRAHLPDPTVSLTGGEVRSGARRDRVVGINVSIPLPVLNSGSDEVAVALAEAEAAQARMRALELAQGAVLTEARTRYAALREAAIAFHAGRTGTLAPRTALLEKLWRAGEIDTGDYLMQLKQSLDTELSGLALESQAWQAWFDYLSAADQLDAWLGSATVEASR